MWPGGSPTAVNGAAGLTVVALIIAALYFGRDLLIPLAVAGILSFILAPLLRRLTNGGLPRGPAVALVIAAVVAALTTGVTLAGRQVAALIEDVPRYELNLRDKARFVHSFFGTPGTWQRAVDTLQRVAEEVRNPGTDGEPLRIEVAQNSSQPIAILLSFTRSTLPTLATTGLALLFTIFILLQYSDLRERRAADGGQGNRPVNPGPDRGRIRSRPVLSASGLSQCLVRSGGRHGPVGDRNPECGPVWGDRRVHALRSLCRIVRGGAAALCRCRDDRSGMVEAG